MYNDTKIMGLICCRGGSKGIPGKNIKEFAGKPLLAWILTAARGANVFDEIILSTDSEEIAEVGKAYGATVPGLRPAHLAQDTSDQFETHRYIFELLNVGDTTHRVCILVNNPFIQAGLISEGYRKATETNFTQVVLDCCSIGGDYVFYRQLFDHRGQLHFRFPKTMLESQINRQTISPCYTSINNMRWAKPSVLSNYDEYKENIVINGIIPVWLPKLCNFDIDEMEDWFIAEAVMEHLQKNAEKVQQETK